MKKEIKNAVRSVEDAKRMERVASRMVGFLRLMKEQSTEQYTDVVKQEIAINQRGWRTLKKYIRARTLERLLTPTQVEDVLRNMTKEKGSLSELVFPKYDVFPKQTILIRIGNAVESAIQEYLSEQYTDISDKLRPVVKEFLDKNIQLDVAIEKDNTYFVSELKYNMNLDTEKASKIVEKLDLLGITLKKFFKHQGISTNVTFVSLRYPYAEDIINLKPEFKTVKNQYVLGYVEFFKMYGIEVTQKQWEQFHRELGREILKTYKDAYEKMSGDRK